VSKIKELFIEIEYLLEKDMNPIAIAKRLDIPVTMVYDTIETLESFEIEDYSPYSTINS
jgi:hypothetical protein